VAQTDAETADNNTRAGISVYSWLLQCPFNAHHTGFAISWTLTPGLLCFGKRPPLPVLSGSSSKPAGCRLRTCGRRGMRTMVRADGEGRGRGLMARADGEDEGEDEGGDG